MSIREVSSLYGWSTDPRKNNEQASSSGAEGAARIAILLYGAQSRDASAEDKYRLLVEAMAHAGWSVRTLNYHRTTSDSVRSEARTCSAVLVWINPIEPDLDRRALDELLRDLAAGGVLVSAHPDIILKLGTKDVLVESQSVGWTTEAFAYPSIAEFRGRFPRRAGVGPRVLKQHRGNGGQGVWKVSAAADRYTVESAVRGSHPASLSAQELFEFFDREVFGRGSHLIDQAWIPTMTRGMVRAYLCGTRVAGFGYQEINLLDPDGRPPSVRHYFSESCFLFQPLRARLEDEWLPRLAKHLQLQENQFPLLWDADFFLCDAPQSFQLCEINVSCVSPFPPSAVEPMVKALRQRLPGR